MLVAGAGAGTDGGAREGDLAFACEEFPFVCLADEPGPEGSHAFALIPEWGVGLAADRRLADMCGLN